MDKPFLCPDEEYHRQKSLLEMELESLVVLQANAAEEAGKLVQDLSRLWAAANLTEQRKLLLTMLDATTGVSVSSDTKLPYCSHRRLVGTEVHRYQNARV